MLRGRSRGHGGPGTPRPARTSHPGRRPPPPPRRLAGRRVTGANAGTANRLRLRLNRPANRRRRTDQDQSFGDLRPLNTQAQALVMSVVDERTLGPVTRSRLTLRVQPTEGEPFEVTTRVAFPTPEERARVKVGGTIPVRYDSYDHRRVVVDPDQEAGELRLLVRRPVRRPGRCWQGARRAGGPL